MQWRKNTRRGPFNCRSRAWRGQPLLPWNPSGKYFRLDIRLRRLSGWLKKLHLFFKICVLRHYSSHQLVQEWIKRYHIFQKWHSWILFDIWVGTAYNNSGQNFRRLKINNILLLLKRLWFHCRHLKRTSKSNVFRPHANLISKSA